MLTREKPGEARGNEEGSVPGENQEKQACCHVWVCESHVALSPGPAATLCPEEAREHRLCISQKPMSCMLLVKIIIFCFSFIKNIENTLS